MDKIFKIGVLVLGFGYLAYLFCTITNQIGRYHKVVFDGKDAFLDTVTADTYYLQRNVVKEKDYWLKFNPTTGKQTAISINYKDFKP